MSAGVWINAQKVTSALEIKESVQYCSDRKYENDNRKIYKCWTYFHIYNLDEKYFFMILVFWGD